MAPSAPFPSLPLSLECPALCLSGNDFFSFVGLCRLSRPVAIPLPYPLRFLGVCVSLTVAIFWAATVVYHRSISEAGPFGPGYSRLSVIDDRSRPKNGNSQRDTYPQKRRG